MVRLSGPTYDSIVKASKVIWEHGVPPGTLEISSYLYQAMTFESGIDTTDVVVAFINTGMHELRVEVVEELPPDVFYVY